ncbi:MAG: helix-turn-helix domain-containing protein, partial [Verrucomicrobia bacterium]
PARRRRYSIGIVGFTAWGSVQANLRGAALYARQCPEIEVHLTPPDDDSHDGYLIASNAPAVRAAVEKHIRLDKPLAFIDQHHFGPRSFSITGDNADYGRVAAAHLIARGNRHLAFYHHLAPNSPWWQAEEGTDFRVSERFRGFVEQARRSGIHPSEVPLLASADPEALKAWLRKLPRPVGILCFNDFWALRVIQACRALRLRVPEDVAVVGIDDHPLLCRFSTPTITSVRTGFIRAGYEGLALLHSVLTGSPVPRTTTPIPACAVIPRRSTWGYAAHDALLNRAFAFMQAHLAERLTIPDIAAGIGSHPRTLESHFERHLRSGVHAELQRMRIDHACRLLATTALSVKEVSAMAGFPHAQSLCRAFSQATGLTPLAWREHRGDSFAERPEPALPGTGAGS